MQRRRGKLIVNCRKCIVITNYLNIYLHLEIYSRGK